MCFIGHSKRTSLVSVLSRVALVDWPDLFWVCDVEDMDVEVGQDWWGEPGCEHGTCGGRAA